MEGVVAKRLDSTYQPGPALRRVAQGEAHQGQELVVGGWLPGAGRLDGRLGSLLVGYYDDGVLRYAGRVGSGLDERTRSVLEAKLAPLARDTSPFDEDTEAARRRTGSSPSSSSRWRSRSGRSAGILRAPRYQGLRDDKDASEVVREIR